MLVRIGTRDSRLAMVQAEMVKQSIKAYDNSIDVRLVPMKTTGDIILDKTLDKIGGKGLFVKELDRALLEGEVDITVHSGKDMPMDLAPGLHIAAASVREDPRDALILPEGISVWDKSKPVGCSSARRRVQLKALYPDIQVLPVRGNVQTRLGKLDSGEFSALILAAAGLKRLNMEARISRLFDTDDMLPSACQGILAVEARQGYDASFLSHFGDCDSMNCLRGERAFVRALDGGCSKPCAAFAAIDKKGVMTLKGMYVSDDETIVRYGEISCTPAGCEEPAERLAERLKYE